MDLVSLQPFGLHIGILAGFIQVLAYVLYIRSTEIEPEPLSWFMWGSTTWIIALMEGNLLIFQHGGWANVPYGERALLTLPILCGCMSAFIAIRCWYRGTLEWPREWQGKVALILGMSLSVVYLGCLMLERSGVVATVTQVHIGTISLIVLSATTVIEFWPMIRNVALHPEDEQPLPWRIWTSAYVLLLIATLVEKGFSLLIVYPAINILLHGCMTWLTTKSEQEHI